MPRKPETFRRPRLKGDSVSDRLRERKLRQDRREYDADRGSASSRGYGARWRRLRSSQLSREPLCRPCGEAGRTTPATEVDHIVPIRDGGKRFSRENLQSICRQCHNAKHGKGWSKSSDD